MNETIREEIAAFRFGLRPQSFSGNFSQGSSMPFYEKLRDRPTPSRAASAPQ
ncbi:hypothetical protein GCM10007968_25430 [Sporolactobacillus putidus]|uniref:Uncharacterized protein n=1 Tax=Sporolactobacillus putidus TaxID=492735 RepID=A0A917S7T3_9BACL|nr:hypothetical protein GCM10007968_25430 [Sporolactobacillus putidus]